MKIFKHGVPAIMLIVVFMLGFVTTETVVVAESPAQTPPVAPIAAPASDVNTILLVILSFILPPLAVYLVYEEIGTPFLVNVILTILFWIPGVIHALYHVLK